MACERQPCSVDANIDGATDGGGDQVAHPLASGVFFRCRKREVAVSFPGHAGGDDKR